MATEQPRVPGKKTERHLTFTTLLTVIVLVLGAVGGSYVYGVITGRKASAPGVEETRGPDTDASVPPLPETILRPQDLEYAQVLRGEERRKPAPVAETPEPRTVEQPGQAAAPPAVGEQAVPEAQRATEAPKEAQELQDYVFQLAALKDSHAADQLRERLEGFGFRTRLERSGQYFLVLVPLRGDSQRVEDLAQVARFLKLGEPLLRARKPVSR